MVPSVVGKWVAKFLCRWPFSRVCCGAAHGQHLALTLQMLGWRKVPESPLASYLRWFEGSEAGHGTS